MQRIKQEISQLMNKIDDTSRSAGHDRADDLKSDISATSAPILIQKDENLNLPSYQELEHKAKRQKRSIQRRKVPSSARLQNNQQLFSQEQISRINPISACDITNENQLLTYQQPHQSTLHGCSPIYGNQFSSHGSSPAQFKAKKKEEVFASPFKQISTLKSNIKADEQNQNPPQPIKPIVKPEPQFSLQRHHSKNQQYQVQSKPESDAFILSPQYGTLSSIEKLSQSSQKKIVKGEYYVLKQNYQSLQIVLKQNNKIREEQEQKIKQIQEQTQEMKMNYELQIDTLRLQNINLQSKIRVLQEKSQFKQIFQVFNQDIQKLSTQLKESQTNVVILTSDKKRNSQVDISGVTSNQARLKKIIKFLQRDVQNLTKDNNQLKTMARGYKLQQKHLQQSTKKANYFKRMMDNAKECASQKEQQAKTLEADIQNLVEQMSQIQLERQDCLKNNAILLQQIALLRDFAYNTENDALRKHYHNFVEVNKNKQEQLFDCKSKNQKRNVLINIIKRLEGRVMSNITNENQRRQINKLIDHCLFEAQTLIEAVNEVGANQSNLLDLLSTVQEKIEVCYYCIAFFTCNQDKFGMYDQQMKGINKQLRNILMRKAKI